MLWSASRPPAAPCALPSALSSAPLPANFRPPQLHVCPAAVPPPAGRALPPHWSTMTSQGGSTCTGVRTVLHTLCPHPAPPSLAPMHRLPLCQLNTHSTPHCVASPDGTCARPLLSFLPNSLMVHGASSPCATQGANGTPCMGAPPRLVQGALSFPPRLTRPRWSNRTASASQECRLLSRTQACRRPTCCTRPCATR